MKAFKILILIGIALTTINNSFAQTDEYAPEPSAISIEEQTNAKKSINRNIKNIITNSNPEELKKFLKYYNQLNKRYSKFEEKDIKVNINNKDDLREFFKENFTNKIQLKDSVSLENLNKEKAN